jgi:hypothetical protein
LTIGPHNINKAELEELLTRVAEIKRIKIFQRALEKKASAYISFRSSECAKRATVFLKQQPPGVFKESNELAVVEYPATESSRLRHALMAVPPDAQWEEVEPVGTLSKKARKLAAAENRIVYVRQVMMEPEDLRRALEAHGKLRGLYVIPAKPNPFNPAMLANLHLEAFTSLLPSGAASKRQLVREPEPEHTSVKFDSLPAFTAAEPSELSATEKQAVKNVQSVAELVEEKESPGSSSGVAGDTEQEDLEPKPTAFALFETPAAAAQAIAQKTGGCTLPRHKRYIELKLVSTCRLPSLPP